MQTVPTVAATATILAFASIGCALGRVDETQARKRKLVQGIENQDPAYNRPDTRSSSRPSIGWSIRSSPRIFEAYQDSASIKSSASGPTRAVPSSSFAATATSTPLEHPFPNRQSLYYRSSRPNSSQMATIASHSPIPPPIQPLQSHPVQSLPKISHSSRQSYDGRVVSGKVRRLTISNEDAAQQRRQDHDRSDSVPPEDPPRQPRLRRSQSARNSWMKRISFISSRSASPAPSDGGYSPALAQSVDAKSFSQSSSTAPILGPRPATAGPNKLVKRFSSQQQLSASASSRNVALPRPATSHQRSALQQQEPTNWSDEAVIEPDQRSSWKQFFGLKKSKRYSSDPSSIRRIIPDNRYVPTLISAKSILTSSMDVDNISEDNDSLIDFASRPTSRDDNRPRSAALDSILAESPDEQVDALGINRRFSISNLIKHRSSNGLGKKPVKLVKRNSRRIVSEPLQSVGLHIDESDHERPNKKRQLASMDTQTALHANAAAASETSTDDPKRAFPAANSTPSPLLSPNQLRRSNASAAVSEHLSTLVGSDNETSRIMNFAEDDDTDHSTLFDSIRTRGTRSTSGAHRPRIETIFDESPSPPVKPSPKLREILPEGMLGSPSRTINENKPRIEEVESINTPVRTVRSDRADDGSPTVVRIKSRTPLSLLSSPTDLTKALSLGTLEYDDEPVEEDDDESRWSCLDNESTMDLHEDEAALGNEPSHNAGSLSNSEDSTPKFGPDDSKDLRKDGLTGLFNYSEHVAEKSSGDRSPPRPRTVHGKKDTTRGSRPVGRRAPSGLHARSQSVPVAPGQGGKRDPVVTNKFGTWGVGSKGVSDEKWDDDFDFDDELDLSKTGSKGVEAKRVDSNLSMRIPQTIRESQVKVVNNIELVRKFGLLIEDLKVYRLKAAERNLLDSGDSSLWREVDAMIELADQEVNDPLLPTRDSPPSSPNLDDSFDDAPWSKSTPEAPRSKSRRRSVLPSESDVFSTPTSQGLHSSPILGPIGRPRKDSEAMARSVIEALHRRRDDKTDSLALQPVPPQKKVPFDTTTLRYITGHVQKLIRRVESSLEGGNGGAALRDLFKDPNHDENESDDINLQMRSMDLS